MAQWGHRLSVDIDLWLPGRETLIDLLQHDERNVVGRLGGEPEIVDAVVTTAFAHGSLPGEPDPRRGHEEALIDGKKAILRSSVQILRTAPEAPVKRAGAWFVISRSAVRVRSSAPLKSTTYRDSEIDRA